MYKIHNNLTPDAMSAIIKNNDNIKRYQLRKKLKIDVPRFNTIVRRQLAKKQFSLNILSRSRQHSLNLRLAILFKNCAVAHSKCYDICH